MASTPTKNTWWRIKKEKEKAKCGKGYKLPKVLIFFLRKL